MTDFFKKIWQVPWILLVMLAIGIGVYHPLPQDSPAEHLHGAAALHEHAGEPRSPQWPKVRAAYIADHPACECCGENHDLQVHHVLAFHLHPEHELDPANLITLCRRCHLLLGHSGNFKLENAHVREDAALIRKHIEEAKQGALAP